MTKVTQDAELMEQWLPAKPIADTEGFYVVYDNNRSPMVFSIGSEGKRYLIKKNAKGVNELLELSSKFNVPKNHRAVALNVTQDSQLMTCIAFATEEKGKASSLNLDAHASRVLSLQHNGMKTKDIENIVLFTNLVSVI